MSVIYFLLTASGQNNNKQFNFMFRIYPLQVCDCILCERLTYIHTHETALDDPYTFGAT